MTVRDIFGLIVRVGGLICVVFGFFDVFRGMAGLTGLPMPHAYPATLYAIGAADYFVTGLLLLLGAGPITRLAYWRSA